MTKAKSGGGLTSNKLVRPSIKTGQPYKGSSPAAADYIGQATAFKKEAVEMGPAYTGSKLGNEVALNVGKANTAPPIEVKGQCKAALIVGLGQFWAREEASHDRRNRTRSAQEASSRA